jgi:hypothetical protein
MIVFIAVSSIASPKIDSLKILNQKNVELSNEIAKNGSEIQGIKSLVEVSNGVISNQLSASQHTISTVSTFFTVIGLFLAVALPVAAWYIKRLANSVRVDLNEAKAALEKINEVKISIDAAQQNVNEIQETIKNNLTGLYQSLQHEEIKAIFDRLENEPADLQHFFPKLATNNQLSGNYFENLKSIHNKLFITYTNVATQALILISQHYPKQAFNDNEVLSLLKSNNVLSALYTSEFKNYQNALCEFLNDKDISNYMLLFEHSFEAIGVQEHPLNYMTITFLAWNQLLNNTQKQVILTELNNPEKCPSFKYAVPGWEEIIKSAIQLN